jgi:ribosome recycling factor
MNLDDVKQKMAKAIEFVKADVATIKTGKANPAVIENISVSAYGGSTRLKVLEMATISVPDAQSLLISPFDKSTVGEIRRDIEAANIGFTPIIDNGMIRINVPALTTERRQEYVKLLHRKLEDGRVKVRQIRHDLMSELKRAGEEGEVNEDERTRLEKDLQTETDKMMEEIEKIGETKEKELMTV